MNKENSVLHPPSQPMEKAQDTARYHPHKIIKIVLNVFVTLIHESEATLIGFNFLTVPIIPQINIIGNTKYVNKIIL